jgi:hypothetical protein
MQITGTVKELVWRLGGCQISPGYARSWMDSRGPFRWFVQRLGDKTVPPAVGRKFHHEFGWAGGYVGYTSPRWTCTFMLHWKGEK